LIEATRWLHTLELVSQLTPLWDCKLMAILKLRDISTLMEPILRKSITPRKLVKKFF
jgi:hypothetical protein